MRRTDSTEGSTDPFDVSFFIFIEKEEEEDQPWRLRRHPETHVDSKGVAAAVGYYGWPLSSNSNKIWEKGYSEGLQLLLIQWLRLQSMATP